MLGDDVDLLEAARDAVARRDDAGAAQEMSAHLRVTRARLADGQPCTSDRIRVAGRYHREVNASTVSGAAVVFTNCRVW